MTNKVGDMKGFLLPNDVSQKKQHALGNRLDVHSLLATLQGLFDPDYQSYTDKYNNIFWLFAAICALYASHVSPFCPLLSQKTSFAQGDP